MRNLKFAVVLIIAGMVLPFCGFSQGGPGGVRSNDGFSFLRIWLKGNYGILDSSGYVKNWKDISGYNHNFSVRGADHYPKISQTQLNGFPVVEFDGENDFIQNRLQEPFTLTDYTIFTVMKVDPKIGNTDPFPTNTSILSTSTNDTSNYTMEISLNEGKDFEIRGNNVHKVKAAELATMQEFNILAIRRMPQEYFDVFQNGAINSKSVVVPIATAAKHERLKIATNRMQNRFLKGKYAEIIMFYDELNDAEVHLVQNYLSAKYNLPMVANDFYQGDEQFNYRLDVAGIGRDVNGMNIMANSAGMILQESPTGSFLKNAKDFVMVGHNSPNNRTTRLRLPNDPAWEKAARWKRVWYADVSDSGSNAGNINLYFDFPSAGIDVIPIADNYVVLYAPTEDADFVALPQKGKAVGYGVEFTIPVSPEGGTTKNKKAAAEEPNGMTDGFFTLGSMDTTISPLPVELVSFMGRKENEGVKLLWATASEQNSEKFILQRSPDQFSFQEIGEVPSKGNSSHLVKYSFTDKNPEDGMNYYRLKQIDFNGDFEYSSIIAIPWRKKELSENKMQINGNPIVGNLNGQVEITEPGKYKIFIVTMDGRNVYFNEKDYSKGIHSFNIDFSKFRKGNYILTITNGKEVMKTKFYKKD